MKNKKIKILGLTTLIIAVLGLLLFFGQKADTKATRLALLAKRENKTVKNTIENYGLVAPYFKLPSTSGEEISLSDFKGKKNVLIYFNEGLSCDPCIEQIPELEKYLSEFEKIDVVLINVMYDNIDDLKLASSRYGIKTPMLSYKNAETEIDYDLTRFSMGMGRRAGHTFILVGKDGKILWRKDYWPGYGMMVQNGTMFVQGEDVLREMKSALHL